MSSSTDRKGKGKAINQAPRYLVDDDVIFIDSTSSPLPPPFAALSSSKSKFSNPIPPKPLPPKDRSIIYIDDSDEDQHEDTAFHPPDAHRARNQSLSASTSSKPKSYVPPRADPFDSSTIDLTQDDDDLDPVPRRSSQTMKKVFASSSEILQPQAFKEEETWSDIDESDEEDEEDETEEGKRVGTKAGSSREGSSKGRESEGSGKGAGVKGKKVKKEKKGKTKAVDEEDTNQGGESQYTYRSPGCCGNGGGSSLSLRQRFLNALLSVDTLSLFLSHPVYGKERCRIFDEAVDKSIDKGRSLESFHRISRVFSEVGMGKKCKVDEEELAALLISGKQSADQAKVAGVSSEAEDEFYDWDEDEMTKVIDKAMRRLDRAENDRAERLLLGKKKEEAKKRGESNWSKIILTDQERDSVHPHPNLPPPPSSPTKEFEKYANLIFRQTTVSQNFWKQTRDIIEITAAAREKDGKFVGRTTLIGMIQCVIAGEGLIAERDIDGKWVTEGITSDLEHLLVDMAKKLGFFDGEDFIEIDSLDGRCGGGILQINYILTNGIASKKRLSPTSAIAHAATSINRGKLTPTLGSGLAHALTCKDILAGMFLTLYKVHHVAPGAILAQSALTQRVLGLVKKTTTYRDHSIVSVNLFDEIPTILCPSIHPTVPGRTLSSDFRAEWFLLLSHQIAAAQAFHQSPSADVVKELVEKNLGGESLDRMFPPSTSYNPASILLQTRQLYDLLSQSIGRTPGRETFEHLTTRLRILPDDSFSTMGSKIMLAIKLREGKYEMFRERNEDEKRTDYLAAEVRIVMKQRRADEASERRAIANAKRIFASAFKHISLVITDPVLTIRKISLSLYRSLVRMITVKVKCHRLASGRMVNTFVIGGYKMSRKRQESGEFIPFDLIETLDQELATALDKNRIGKQDCANRQFNWDGVLAALQHYDFFRTIDAENLKQRLRTRHKQKQLPELSEAAWKAPVEMATPFPWDEKFIDHLADNYDNNRRIPDKIKSPFSFDVIIREMSILYPTAFIDVDKTKLSSRVRIQLDKMQDNPLYARLAKVVGVKKRAKVEKGKTGQKRVVDEDDDGQGEKEKSGPGKKKRKTKKTYAQPPESLGVISTIPYEPFTPSSSNCQTFSSAQLYTAAAALASSSPSSSASSASATSGASSGTSTGTQSGAATSSRATGGTGANAAQTSAPANGSSSLKAGGLFAGVLALAATFVL
ncbi:hypothetical protein JCM5353_001885 [Sporobolomyces roseus]